MCPKVFRLFYPYFFLISFYIFIGTTNGETSTTTKLDPGTQLSVDIASGRKRKVVMKENDDSDEDATTAPPTNDIYRSRHQKKAR